jgi:hypothetical protein
MSKKKSNVFTRDSLLNFKNEPKEFEIKGYGSVFVRPLTLAEGLALEKLSKEVAEKPTPKGFAEIIKMGLCDEAGQPMFTDSDLSQLETLPSALGQAMALCVALGNGMQPSDIEQAQGN